MIQYIEAGWFDEVTGDYHEKGYYFWDEPGLYAYGPYETCQDAKEARHTYAKMYLGL